MSGPKKYGLIIKKKTVDKPLKKTAVFGNDSSGDEDAPKSNINVSIMREAQKKKQMKQTQLEIEKALKEDPSVYEYDNIYEEMTEKKKAAIPKLVEKDKKPKYIKGLLESAKSRKMEDERRMERKIQKEREQEGGEFKEKEEFVTSAYRKRMLELQEEEKQLKKQEALDAANDVTRKSDLTAFYSNLLKHNVSMGGSFTVDSKKYDVEDKDVKQTTGSREDTEQPRAGRDDHQSSSGSFDSGHSHKEYKNQRNIAPKENSKTYVEESDVSSKRRSENRRYSDDDDRSSEGSSRQSDRRRYPNEEKQRHKEKRPNEDVKCVKTDIDIARSNTVEHEKPAQSSKFNKRSNNDTIMSARERYLERKRARESKKKQTDSDDDED